MVLSANDLKKFYDRFGRKQDSQGFYEDPAIDELVAHASFETAETVFELGCGTGKFAERLLARHLPPSATYSCIDVSDAMVKLARDRVERYSDRVTVARSDGAIRFPLPDRSADRVVCAYVLDLLSDKDIRLAFSEAYRVLAPGGRFCTTCLTHGVTILSRGVSSFWSSLFRFRPAWVGGCRPISLLPFVDRQQWHIEHRSVLTPYGVPSEVMVLTARVLIAGGQEGASS